MDAQKPYLAAVLVQLTYTGFYVMSKDAFDEGVSTFVFIFYRQAAACLLLVPLAVIFERNRSPPLKLVTAVKMFLHALIGGPRIHPFHLHGHFAHSPGRRDHAPANTPKATWIEGTFFVIGANLTWSLWLVYQGILLKEYPSKLMLTTLQCLLSAVQSLFVAMAFERESSKWKLNWDMGLLAILYSGFIVTGVSFYLQSWCVEKKGPVFVAIFTPLSLVFTMICSTIFLGEMITLGSVLGGLLMVGGLYSFLWGKSKETMPCEVSIEDGNTCMRDRDAQPL
ncbi:hypothetical protein C4D60_Mb10t19170 [Musa balbisiana]|uniref:WAT1-related protein n=1 Tax=Musa balbisiana TaxID=52838 RepID=A0A4S8J0R4_MUSBA|nr:hypothetical protein C4D60_Mb10t19170 [Musa balbisiana]